MATALVLFQGCKKPTDDLGPSLLDPADTMGLHAVSVDGIVAWTRPETPLGTAGLSQSLVGTYYDPFFGEFAVGLAAQLRLSTNAVGPADPGLVCDSLVLAMVYSSTTPIYGSAEEQVFKVYRITEALRSDSAYTSARIPQHDGVDLVVPGQGARTPVLDQGPWVGGDSLPAQLRVPLSNDLGNELLALWGGPEVATSDAFLQYFKGIHVEAAPNGHGPGNGGVIPFNLMHGHSKLTLYYRTGAGVARTYDFIFTSGSVRWTTASAQRSGYPVDALVTDTARGQQQLAVQALGGLRTEIRLPDLVALEPSPRAAVARAVLVIPVEEADAAYPPPAQLFMFRRNAEGNDAVMPDQVSGQGSIDGVYDAVAKQYRFNITRWVQGVRSGLYPDNGLGLMPGSSGITVNRAVLNGPEHPDRPMRMEINFTTF